MTKSEIAKLRTIAEYAKSPSSVNDIKAFDYAANPAAILSLIQRLERLENHLRLALSFAPKGPVPKGLAPMFYYTLDYESEVELQKRIDEAREALLDEGSKT